MRRAGVLRYVVVVFVGLVIAVLVLGKLGAEIGSSGLLVLVCLAVLAIAFLSLRNRSNR
jgi:hypothetical protein